MKDTIFPYPTIRGGVELKVTEFRADGEIIRVDPVQLAEGTLEIGQLGPPQWDRLSLAMDVQAQPSALDAYEQEHGRVALTLVASCRPSNVRQAIPCERSAL